jgi:Lipocalin-like domain
MKKLLFSALALTLLATACKKKDDEPTRTELLTASGWKYAQYGLDANKNGAIEAAESQLDACELDDTYTFANGGSLTQNVGTVKCFTGETNTTGTWALKNNDTQVDITIFGFTTTLTINELSSSRLVLKEIDGTDQYLSIFTK